MIIAGPSGCGKTVFTRRLLQQQSDLFRDVPFNRHYCYGAWQPTFSDMKKQDKIDFHEGIPDVEQLDQWYGKTKGGLLVLDDLMEEGSNDKRVVNLFTKHCHHRNITLLFLTQDLFPPGKFSKTISRNVHYMIAFKSPRDQTAIRTVLLQAFPTVWKDALQIFQLTTQRPYGYLWLDLHPGSDDRHRLFANVLKEEGPTIVYEKTQ